MIGGGPAGLAAALAAARAGARVILFDDQAEFGGSLLAETKARIDGADASVWLAATLAELAASPRVTLLPRTQAFGLYAQNFIGARAAADRPSRRARSAQLPRERLWQVRAKRIVLATGAFERPLVFPDNDRPGIMLAEAARTLVDALRRQAGRARRRRDGARLGLSRRARPRRGGHRDRDDRRPQAERRRRAAASGAPRRAAGSRPIRRSSAPTARVASPTR